MKGRPARERARFISVSEAPRTGRSKSKREGLQGDWYEFAAVVREYPALRPAIIAAGLFGFLLSFNELPRSIFLRGRETTLPLCVWARASSHTSNVPLIYALSTIVLLVSPAVITSAFWLLFAREEADSEQTRG